MTEEQLHLLPAQVAEHVIGDEPEHDPSASQPPVGQRILVIEDDQALARVIQLRLQRLGYQVEIERQGPDGLARLLESDFDLALLDYKLPGMNGLEIMRALNSLNPMPPVVMLSGVGDLTVAVEAMKLGAVDYVIKEVNRGYFELLESTIQRCLDQARMKREKLEAERNLARTTTQLSATLTSMSQGLCVFDGQLRLAVWNDNFAKIFDYPPELVQEGTHLREFLAYRWRKGEMTDFATEEEALVAKLLEAVPKTSRVYEISRGNGQVIEVRANPIPDGGFVAVQMDVTERHRNEEALRESEERYRRMSEFASSVIHNVGNVLSSINVSCGAIYHSLRASKLGQLNKTAKLLEEHAEEPSFLINHPKGKLLPGYLARLGQMLGEEKQETVDEVQSVLKNLLLITQIIEYQQSKGKRDELLEVLDISHAVEDALNVKQEALTRENVAVETQFGVLLVKCQKAKLTHILINLIKNAVEAMSERPGKDNRLRITSGILDTDEPYLDVIDNGPGIAPEVLANVFSHGFTTKDGGHGFGLHYCQNAAEEMDCRIEAFSEGVNQGATFRLIFAKLN